MQSSCLLSSPGKCTAVYIYIYRLIAPLYTRACSKFVNNVVYCRKGTLTGNRICRCRVDSEGEYSEKGRLGSIVGLEEAWFCNEIRLLYIEWVLPIEEAFFSLEIEEMLYNPSPLGLIYIDIPPYKGDNSVLCRRKELVSSIRRI